MPRFQDSYIDIGYRMSESSMELVVLAMQHLVANPPDSCLGRIKNYRLEVCCATALVFSFTCVISVCVMCRIREKMHESNGSVSLSGETG